ncbi:MAG: hypothetical protein DRP65_10735 [Planctomycetota bacterium]|nr:MAG: hypothetical protein DRP65_10735 [Planctomycetota bacterium]
MTKLTDKAKRILPILAILAIGIVVLTMLILLRKPPAKKRQEILSPLLNSLIVHKQDMEMVIRGYGTVEPKVEVQVVPQVSGRVVNCHKDFVNGGFFKAGQALITIDQRDYKLAVQNAEAAVATSRVYLDRELAEAKVARQEWQQLNPNNKPTSPLVFHEPQIAEAKARLKASQAQLATAKLNLERTVISMPFDGRIASESLDVGQYLMAGQSVATVYGTDVAEIVVPLEDRDMAWFDVPARFSDSANSPLVSGAEALVTADFAGARHTWAGRVARTEGRIDSTSRMVNVVVEVVNPFELSNHRPPLVPGMFVEIEIKGKTLEGVTPVPRYAVHNGDEVWVCRDGRLRIQKVNIARQDKNYAYITDGLEDRSVIIISSFDAVTDGMKIRTHLTDAEVQKEFDSK